MVIGPRLKATPSYASPVLPQGTPTGAQAVAPAIAPGATANGWLSSIGARVTGFFSKLWQGIQHLFGRTATPATYTVLPGDTLYGIAKKTLGDGERWREIYALNQDQISNPNLIHAGMVLKIPGGKASAPKPSNPPVQQPPASSGDLAAGLAIPAPGSNPSHAVMDTLLGRAADKYGIPRAILKAIALRESNWRQYDSNGNPVAGRNPSTTDWGVMQINDYWHPDAFPRAKTDVAFNVEYGAKYLASQYKRYGDWHDAVAAYNAGSVQKDPGGHYKNQPYVDFVFGHTGQFA